jgi:5-methylcytosine-specific restriction endonuclease McrA
MGRIDRTKRFCSRLCVEEFKLRTDAKVMRRFIFERDLGCCAECGTRWPWNGDFQVDHEQPLFLAADDWAFWEPENQRILCTKPCHVDKTAQDRTLMKPAIKTRQRNRRKTNLLNRLP